MLCACGSEKSYSECCGAFIEGAKTPSTPEELMRSRYTAYTKNNIDYIARTMKSPAADRFNAADTGLWAEKIEWINLEVIASSMDGSKGFVEFIAHFFQSGKRHVLHELSEFRLDDGIWYYVDGKGPKDIRRARAVTQIGRNEPCLCDSGKKYKKCCGRFA